MREGRFYAELAAIAPSFERATKGRADPMASIVDADR
jgi:hypothetical protein